MHPAEVAMYVWGVPVHVEEPRVETSAIAYRVADFLKKYPPFQALDEADLVALAGSGRVRFYEANEYLIWQGEPHKPHLFVIQQGTVSLWDEREGRAILRDVRGAGDMLGLERYGDARSALHTAMSESDVVVYTFPSTDFDELVLKSPYARAFVEADGTVTTDYQWAKDARDPRSMFLHDIIRRPHPEQCRPDDSLRHVARTMMTTGIDAVAVVGSDDRLRGIATSDMVLSWVAGGSGHADQPIGGLLEGPVPTVGAASLLTDAVLALAETGAPALAVTSDGSGSGRLAAVVTSRDVGRAFGDQPTAILREISLATTSSDLRDLLHRTRALVLQVLTSAASVDWLARFASLADAAIVRRLVAIHGGGPSSHCWCVCDGAGRGETLTRQMPRLVVITEDEPRPEHVQLHARVSDALTACDYLPDADAPFEGSFHVASRATWQERYRNWLYDPVRSEMYLARPLFDLRPIEGPEELWRAIESSVDAGIDRNFLHVLANDCLANLPPLTFFEDAVVEKSGEHATVFRLEESVLRPLVDVGRVFGMASKQVLGTSTFARLTSARALLPEHESVFREASESLRIVLWQQARVGIAQGTTGSELPPSLLSRQDRHLLKGCFRSILRLVELTGNPNWLAAA
jgi:CBS domain-containing protein